MKFKKKLLKTHIRNLVNTGIKFRDDFTCQKSGEKVSGSNCHPSHIIPTSADGRLSLNPRNIKVLSYHNHINRWHKNPLESGKWYRETFPENWEYLEKEHKKNNGKGSIGLDEYKKFAEDAIKLINKYNRENSEKITFHKKKSITTSIRILEKFINYMEEN